MKSFPTNLNPDSTTNDHGNLIGRLVPGILAIPAVMAFTLLAWSTREGIGITPDSVRYVDAARNLIEGNGLLVGGEPLTHYPPLYPALLAIAGLVAEDVITAARWLHALIFAVTIGAVTFCIWRFSGRRLVMTMTASMFLIALPDMLLIQVQALSEPPFLLLTLCGHMLLAYHLTCPDRRFLVAGSVMIGGALLTRYAGIALLPAPLVLLAALRERPVRSRVIDGVIFISFAAGPLFLWLIRNKFVAGSAANRPIAWHPFDMNRVGETIGTLSAWLIPFQTSVFLQTLVLAVFLALSIVLFRLAWKRREEQLRGLLRYTLLVSLFSLFYLGFLVISISIMDAHTLMDARILSPILLLLLCSFCPLLSRAVETRPEKPLPYAVVLIPFALAVGHLPVTINLAGALNTNGFGYTNRSWKQSEGIAVIANASETIPIYTNAGGAPYILTGRHTQSIPADQDTRTREPRPEFSDEIEVMREDVHNHGGMVILFNREAWRWNIPDQKAIMEFLKPVRAEYVGDALVFRAPD